MTAGKASGKKGGIFIFRDFRKKKAGRAKITINSILVFHLFHDLLFVSRAFSIFPKTICASEQDFLFLLIYFP
jgi:hypothetical protein